MEVITEYRNENTKDIDILSTVEMVRKMNEEDRLVALAVSEEIENIARNQKAAEQALVILNPERDEQDVNQTVSSLEMAFDKGEFVSVNSQATSIYKNRMTSHE